MIQSTIVLVFTFLLGVFSTWFVLKAQSKPIPKKKKRRIDEAVPRRKSKPRKLKSIGEDEKEEYTLTPLSFDIGGSLAKIAFLYSGKVDFLEDLPERWEYDETYSLAIKKTCMGGEGDRNPMKIHFLIFPTDDFEKFCKLVKKRGLIEPMGTMKCFGTGGGSRKYAEVFERETGVKLEFRPEMHCLNNGINFVMKGTLLTRTSIFKYNGITNKKTWIEPEVLKNTSYYPFLFCQIGSGVSIIKIDSPSKYQRVSGTALGGATFLGLSKLLVGKSEAEFDEILEMIEKGDNRNVDLLVGDIYGFDVGKFSSLHKDLVASFFGKIAVKKDMKPQGKDLLASLIYMIGVNIAQIVCMCAKLHHVQNLFFSGGFMRKNQHVWKYLKIAINYYAGALGIQLDPYFVKHHRFLGNIGCMIQATTTEDSQEEKGKLEVPPPRVDSKLSLDDKFELACIYVQKGMAYLQYPEKEEIGISERLEFYGYFKQASHGPAKKNPKKKPKPQSGIFFDPTAEIKWRVWEKLGGKVTRKEAKEKYVEKLTQLAPNWSMFEGLEKFKEEMCIEE